MSTTSLRRTPDTGTPSKPAKLTASDVPVDFTLSLVLVDALPVLLFGAACVALSVRISSALFLAGACICLASGAGKVIWKLIVVLAHRNVWPLYRQMHVLMPIGFVLMLVGLVMAVVLGSVTPASVGAALTAFPSSLFLLAWVLAMCAMGYFASHLDSSDPKANWVEQLTNAAGQAALLAAVLLLP